MAGPQLVKGRINQLSFGGWMWDSRGVVGCWVKLSGSGSGSGSGSVSVSMGSRLRSRSRPRSRPRVMRECGAAAAVGVPPAAAVSVAATGRGSRCLGPKRFTPVELRLTTYDLRLTTYDLRLTSVRSKRRQAAARFSVAAEAAAIVAAPHVPTMHVQHSGSSIYIYIYIYISIHSALYAHKIS